MLFTVIGKRVHAKIVLHLLSNYSLLLNARKVVNVILITYTQALYIQYSAPIAGETIIEFN